MTFALLVLPVPSGRLDKDYGLKMAIRWGIVGAGKISNDFVNAFNSYPGKGKDNVMYAIAARNPENAKKFAKTHNIQRIFNSYLEMAKSQDIDIAYIGTLNPQHYELARLFLENGKHVLVEKPLSLNSKQVKSLISLARSKKLFLMEAIWSRCLPSFIALEKEINSGKLGDVLFVEANFGIPITMVERVRKRDLGGGALLDIGLYVLQFAQFVFKEEPIKVVSSGELNEEGMDLAATIILEYSGGRRAVLTANGRLQLDNRATVYGTKGRVTLKDPFHCSIEMINSEGKTERFPLHDSDLPYYFVNSAALVYEALEVGRCIKNGLLESPRMSHNDSLSLAKLEDTIRQQLGVHYDVDDLEYP
ncbi:Trans-1,2-dihydrobenzene-1,2-diol dehydrogenase [Eumeta japonica]|uniref:Trans-1,2-dihydrobenzene-1,2-diol dehydrogenase n=1 Tax=Eumeta variegata TaxID=151549 RepID=A0A4C2A6A4_EUMVA|nr:Trans-1,2-dihydrobenzene-1,2-diol dehydrogenase [Eumeta japonica]